jgi:hypothetical protein
LGSSHLQSFALRALGLVHDDEVLLTEAVAHFDALSLEWHARETRTALGR